MTRLLNERSLVALLATSLVVGSLGACAWTSGHAAGPSGPLATVEAAAEAYAAGMTRGDPSVVPRLLPTHGALASACDGDVRAIAAAVKRKAVEQREIFIERGYGFEWNGIARLGEVTVTGSEGWDGLPGCVPKRPIQLVVLKFKMHEKEWNENLFRFHLDFVGIDGRWYYVGRHVQTDEELEAEIRERNERATKKIRDPAAWVRACRRYVRKVNGLYPPGHEEQITYPEISCGGVSQAEYECVLAATSIEALEACRRGAEGSTCHAVLHHEEALRRRERGVEVGLGRLAADYEDRHARCRMSSEDNACRLAARSLRELEACSEPMHADPVSQP